MKIFILCILFFVSLFAKEEYVHLSKKEKLWIKEHPIITYSEVNWRPLSIIENGTMKGIFGDFLHLISEKTGLRFKYIPSDTWDEVIKKFKNKEIDLLPSNPQNIKNLGLISKVYKTYPMAIVTDERYSYITNLDDLKDKIIAVPKFYTSYNYLKKNYPKIKIASTNNIIQALQLVQDKKADAFIGHIATAVYHMTLLNSKNLKIAGTTDFQYKHSYLIQKEYPELLSIINKGFSLITKEEKRKIFSKYSNITITKEKINYKLVVRIIVITSMFFIFLLYKNKTLKKQAKEIGELKERLELALIGNKDGLWDRDFTNNTVYRSPRWKEIIGYKDDELPNRAEIWEERLHPDDIKDALKSIHNHLNGKTSYYESIHRIKHKNGHWVWVHDRGKRVTNKDSKSLRMIGTCTDITKEKERELRLKHQHQIIEQINECVISTDLNGNIKSWNNGAVKLLGYTKDEIIGKHIDTLLLRKKSQTFKKAVFLLQKEEKIKTELELTAKNGKVVFSECSISVLKDNKGKVIGLIGYIKDITDIKEKEEELIYQANHDALTNLPNRNLLNDRLERAIKRAKRHEERFALFFIDLDRFKHINDSLGHEIGDLVLKEVSKIIKNLLRDEDTLARLGGDEFIIITGSTRKNEDFAILAEKIINSLKKPIIINYNTLYISASIGISIFPNDSLNAKNLLKFADSAMYKAKEEGRNNFQFYSKEMTAIAFEKIAMETKLREAIEKEQFEVYFQPQIDAECDKIIGMEALVRWILPSKTIISPAQFLPLAEDTGMIKEIDKIVMKKAMEQFSKWYRDGLNPGVLSINTSIALLNDKDLIHIIDSNFKIFNFNTKWLKFEVTEGQIMKKPDEIISKLVAINKTGISIAIDDFGTGYSSLSYLKKLPIDTLKIDQSFVKYIPKSEEDISIVKAIIALGKSMKLELIAEGVEEDEQKNFLIQNGCNTIQGYLYSKPLPAIEMEKFLKLSNI